MNQGFVFNGVFVPKSTLEIDPLSPAFANGLGLFETTRLHAGRILFLGPHIERMRGTARRLEIDFPVDEKRAFADVATLVRNRGLIDARIRLQLLVRADEKSDVLWTGETWAPLENPGAVMTIGKAAPLYNGMTAMPGLKTTNYMANRLAEREGRKQGHGEVVFDLPDGTVTEGTRSTLFFCRGRKLHTPGLDLHILPGVTRQVVLEVARERGIEVEEGRYSWAEVQAADEVFMTGSVGGLRPVRAVEGRAIRQAPGPVTLELAQAYGRRADGEPLLSRGADCV